MIPVTLYNTLTKKPESFTPLNPPHVGMYSCGPTVYDYAHIGNLRSYVFADILHRTLAFAGYDVKHVINITDVGHLSSDSDTGEDKMMKGLTREGLPISLTGMKTLAEKYETLFKQNLTELNIKMPDVFPRASEHIAEQITLIQTLEAKGFTYSTTDGIYFDTSKDSKYGALGGLTHTDHAQARVDEHTEKRNPRDFALWKFSSPEKGLLGWESPWGTGFPGWHIECSAMSQKHLGETFDIHTGGIDHIPVHHNNEIAQSENAHGKPLARFWMHNEFIHVDSGKMAKSEGNFITLATLKEHSIHPLSYRYWLLTAHYRSPVTFSFEAVKSAQASLENLIHWIWSTQYQDKTRTLGTVLTDWVDNITAFIYDDLKTPQALAIMQSDLKDIENPKDAIATMFEIDKILGLNLAKLVEEIGHIPEDIQTLAKKRDALRENKQWEESDEIRAGIESQGFYIKDSENSHILWRSLASLIK